MGFAGPIRLKDKQGDTFTLRRYRPEDRDSLEAMYHAFEPKRVAQGLPPVSREQCARWLDAVLGGGHHLVVEIHDHILGHGMLLPFGEDAAELANFLHQEVRDRGIGTALNRGLLDLAREYDVRRVWLSVEPSNRRAIRSYEKVGFRRCPVEPFTPELEMDVVLPHRQTS